MQTEPISKITNKKKDKALHKILWKMENLRLDTSSLLLSFPHNVGLILATWRSKLTNYQLFIILPNSHKFYD